MGGKGTKSTSIKIKPKLEDIPCERCEDRHDFLHARTVKVGKGKQDVYVGEGCNAVKRINRR